ncbi:trans-sialidase [Trypanosoma cruzi cruzi]|nr:trans-sialidase [Trypanosoma cruzi cruzi]
MGADKQTSRQMHTRHDADAVEWCEVLERTHAADGDGGHCGGWCVGACGCLWQRSYSPCWNDRCVLGPLKRATAKMVTSTQCVHSSLLLIGSTGRNSHDNCDVVTLVFENSEKQ